MPEIPPSAAASETAPPRALSACLVALNAGPAITPQTAATIGGLETRAWMFARGLSQRDINVHFVVRLQQQPEARTVEGVRIVPLMDRLYRIRESARHCVARRAGFPWFELRHFRPQLLWQLPVLAIERVLRGGAPAPWRPDRRLTATAADVYCTFGVHSHSATVLASARAAGRPCVLMLGSDGDLDERYTRDSTFVSTYGDPGDVCWRILQEVDAIVAQTSEQCELLQARFGRKATIIRNPIDVAEWDARAAAPASLDETAGLERYVLWVGRAESTHKRPQVCIEVARQCPEIRFLMVMNPREAELEEMVHRMAPPNVRILRAVPFARMPVVFARAAAIVNTSSLEGFPNVFLQAALSRVPIAALQVGESFLQHIRCGCYADGSLDALCKCLRELWQNPPPAAALESAREIVIHEHGLAETSEALAQVLVKTAAARSG